MSTRRAGSRPTTLSLLLVVAGAGDGLGAQAVAPEVEAVEFEGNATFPDDSLSRAIATRETECRSAVVLPFCWLGFDFAIRRSLLSAREVPRDEARLGIWYQRRGFREVAVASSTTVGSAGTAEVTFAISEGAPVIADSIAFVGAGSFADMGLLEDLPVRPGDRWSTLALDATRDTLVQRLRSSGYPRVDVLRQTVFPSGDRYRANVTFEVEPGPYATYGDIRILGIQHLEESTVLQTLPFRSGDPYRVDQLVDGQGRLFGLEIVRTASITPCLNAEPVCQGLLPSPDSIVPLVVQLQEGDPYRVRTGGGWSTAECFNVESRWTSRNFRGGGRVLQLRGRLSNVFSPQFHDSLCPQSGEDDFTQLTWQAAVDFAQPWIFSTRNSFNASLFAERQSVPEIFIRTAVGLQLALVRAIGPQTPLTLSYRPELSRLTAADVLLCTGFLVCESRDIDILTGARRLAPVGLSLTRDLSDSLLNPTRGYRLIVDVEHAGPWTGSEFRYDRVVGEGTLYTGVTDGTVLATRIRGGWVGSGDFNPLDDSDVGNIVHPQKRFYAGGANSVRGFAQSRLGPRVLAVDDPRRLLDAGCTPSEVIGATCDASGVPEGAFVPRPTGGTQVVEGNVEVRFDLATEGLEGVTFVDFGQVWGPTDSPSLDALEFTPGMGIRYHSPLGPIRLDLGYNFRGDELLPVVTRQITPVSGVGDFNFGGQEYGFTSELARLPAVPYGGGDSGFQLHISIGQAF